MTISVDRNHWTSSAYITISTSNHADYSVVLDHKSLSDTILNFVGPQLESINSHEKQRQEQHHGGSIQLTHQGTLDWPHLKPVLHAVNS